MNKIILTQFDDFKEKLKKQLKDYFPENSKIAIKLHMGELGNKHFLNPKYAKSVYEVCKELGYDAFLFDSPVAYTSPRHFSKGYYLVAKKHGFNFCKVKISNDSVKVKEKYLTYEVCKDLIEADGVIVLTHVTGHICSGFGGAIKNLGMGALSKKSKGKIHDGGKPIYDKGCTLCGTCAKNCPTDNIRYENNRPYFDKSWCPGCSNCAVVCPENAIKPKIANFDTLIAEGAHAALKNFKKTYFINILANISEKCDCYAGKKEQKLLGKDIGI
ncbi:unnamed protein product, partial [marine sediment metagenome]